MEAEEKLEAPQPKKRNLKKWFKLAIALFVLGAVLVVPVLGQAREKARRINCGGNLKCTGLALIIYAGDDIDHGYFPSGNDFWLLHDQKYLVEGKIYCCPSALEPTTSSRDSSYQYFGDGICDAITEPQLVPLSADKEGNHVDWFNVCFVDGHVKGYSAPDWQTLVKREGWDTQWERARRESEDPVKLRERFITDEDSGQ